MHAQDVADQQRLARLARRRNDAFGRLERIGERLLAEHVRACGERLERHRGVVLGVGADGDGVGTGRGEGFVERLEARRAGKLRLKVGSLRRVAGAQPDEFELVDRFVGPRVAGPHRAEANHENTHALCAHRSSPVFRERSAAAPAPARQLYTSCIFL